MKRTAVAVSCALFVLLLAAACARPVPQTARPSGTLAVAGFRNPAFTWELLAGYLPREGVKVDPLVIDKLNQSLTNALMTHGTTGYVSMGNTRQCEDIKNYETEVSSRTTALKYWVEVGRCTGADLLLVPQLLYWKERQGKEMGVESPASVMLDIYLINVKEGRIAQRFHFEETQQDLTSNLLDIPKFFERKAKWITAGELADEGIETGLRTLGL